MNLATEYLGLKLKNPLMPGASPLGDDLDTVRRLEDAGAAAIVMHSLFEEQLELEHETVERDVESHNESFAEATTYLPNEEDFEETSEEYLELIGKIKATVSVPVIASLNGTTPGGWTGHAKLIEQAGADALELNYYDLPSDPCRTGAEIEQRALDLIAAIRKEVRIPLAVKLSPFFSSLPNFVSRVKEAGANGVVLFNRFYQPDINIEDLDTDSVLELSTSSELRLRLRWLAVLSAQVDTSYAATGGVHTAEDAVRAIMAGAHAVQMVSALLKNGPDHLAAVLAGLSTWLEEHEYESLAQMRGTMNLKHCPDATAFERANYLRLLKSWHA
ncbi:MAG: dihydroorotate dehydrogenase-like protein [Chthoniobacteraceae bacterium]|nr:dihydroorotate dehydrogenase-like protein [Chthoniobacteraceae bacterium]